MRKSPHSIDGFVPRASRQSIGSAEKTSLTAAGESNRQKLGTPTREISTSISNRQVSRQEIDDSLKGIDDEPSPPKKRGFLRSKPKKKPVSRRKKITKRIVKLLLIIAIIAAAYVGITALMNATKILQGNLFGVFQNKPLQMDVNGRTNILVYGTSGSVDDQRHEGANLTDTIMVLSVNQNNKNAYLVSLPRDLYVEYNASCPEGYRGRINSLYECFSGSEQTQEADEKGAKALESKVTEVTGLSIQYYAHINWAVVVDAIDALDGIKIDVQGNGTCAGFGMPLGSIVDINMGFRYTPGVRVMSGIEALKFSRARGSAGGCGLDRGDYDRQANQQKVLKAMQKKATSAETFTNLGKITGLMNALGENLRTNFETNEIQTIASLAKDIPSDKITSIDLVSDDNRLIYGDMINGASVQIPVAGLYDYSSIKAFIKKKLNSNEITRENAHVAIFNGGSVEGYAQQRATALTERGFNITAIENAPVGEYGRVAIYNESGEKPKSLAKLEQIYGVTAKTGQSPINVSNDTDIVIIYGNTNTTN